VSEPPATPGPSPSGNLRSELLESLSILPGLLSGDGPLPQALAEVCNVCCQTLPDCSAASVVLLEDEGPRVIVNEEQTSVLEQVQMATGRGPCAEAVRTSSVVRAETPDPRFPEFSALAEDRGIRSTICMPIPPQGPAIGTLSLYSTVGSGLTTVHEMAAAVFAAQCALAVAAQDARERAKAIADQMEEALAARAQVDQAKGIVMSIRHCTAEEAQRLLVERSERANRSLDEVAAEILATVRRQG
jgi:GAF domain-containing protein